MKFLILTFSIWFLVLDVHGAVKQKRTPEVPVRSTRSLRQQVDSYAELLEKEVLKAKNTKEKYRVVKKVMSQIKMLRENSAPQGEQDESHMDLLVTTLEAIPPEKQFKKKECYKYESDFIDQFEPTADEAPEEPAVKPSWTVLKSLCR